MKANVNWLWQAQALKNLTAVLEAAGSSIDEVVKVNIFITDMANFGAVNAVYEKVFTKDPKPVSLTFGSWYLKRCSLIGEIG